MIDRRKDSRRKDDITIADLTRAELEIRQKIEEVLGEMAAKIDEQARTIGEQRGEIMALQARLRMRVVA